MATQIWVEAVPGGTASLNEYDWWFDMRALPTLPSVLFRFLGLVGDSKVSTKELADYIWKDPALLSRALPMAAAGWGRGAGEHESLQNAIAALSRERIRNLAFTTPLLRSFEPLETGSYAITFWERSLLCGTACQAAAHHLKLADPERYYVAGLLHDIGYLVLLQKRPTLLPTIRQQWVNRPTGLLEIEEELMGIDHCRLGVQVAARLGLESWIFPAIETHHSPTQDSDSIVRVTAVGGAFANYLGVDFFPRRSLSRVIRDREMQEMLGGLLPDLAVEHRTELLKAMEKAVQPVRKGIRETIIEWQAAGESRLRPYFARPTSRRPAFPAIA
ncbi:MAG: HDOD domain-containing protein [Acidobacteria bacterium]|nr:HDOD domain-containing protein [Acidobacteriota bacterium]